MKGKGKGKGKEEKRRATEKRKGKGKGKGKGKQKGKRNSRKSIKTYANNIKSEGKSLKPLQITTKGKESH